jgi:hypothetical protein
MRKLSYDGYVDEQDLLVFTAQSWPFLEELVFFFCQEDDEQNAGTDILSLICRSCRQLRKLALFRCELTATNLCSIAGLETLEQISLEQCDGLTDTGVAVLATMKLSELSVFDSRNNAWTAASLQSFVGSNISRTLASFHLSSGRTIPMDDVQVATALASCHHLTNLDLWTGGDRCVFGRNGLEGLQAMATGCPLLASVSIYLTPPGIHYLGTHFPNLRSCTALRNVVTGARFPQGFPPIKELQTLYPAVEWH